MRDGNNQEKIVATKAALIQRDGDVVSADGNTVLHLATCPNMRLHLVDHCPGLCSVRNNDGKIPLFVACKQYGVVDNSKKRFVLSGIYECLRQSMFLFGINKS